MSKLIFAIDGMGGDNAPKAVIKGINHFCKHYPFIDNIYFRIYGDSEVLEKFLKHKHIYKHIQGHFEIVHCDDYVPSDAKPAVALKKSKNTSMWQAIASVKNKESDAVISAGNTGCLMAFSTLQLRMLEGIKRAAITAVMPTKTNTNVVMLDLGANLDYNAKSLVDYAIMGAVYSTINSNNDKKPKVGLLNIGEEDTKGDKNVQEAHQILKSFKSEYFDYIGFVEGHDILQGNVDVVVSDGWTGNIALKSIEGTAKFIGFLMKNAFTGKTLWSKFWGAMAYFLIRRGIRKIAKRIDIRRYNGGMFAGLNGVVIKSHGSSDFMAFYYAMHYALNLVQQNFNEKIKLSLDDYHKKTDDK